MTLTFFTALTTLGAPQDVTLQELRVESFFPADEETERVNAGVERFRRDGVDPSMGDITDPRLLYLKGFLFLVLGAMAGLNLLLLHPEWQVAASLAVAVWAFARAYYFAFYVVERYADPGYRFAGLGSFLLYLARRSGR